MSKTTKRTHEHVDKVSQVEWHRNGIGGAGFHVVLFQPSKGYEGTGPMLAVVFDEEAHVAVLEIAPLSDPSVGARFGANSWRGDRFESELRAAIDNGEGRDNAGSIRVGPFGIPTSIPEEAAHE